MLLQGSHVLAVRTGKIEVDGLDATTVALRLLHRLPRRPVLLSGVTYGGFNIVDPRLIHRRLRTPTVVVTGSKPSNLAVKTALFKHFPDWKARWRIIGSLGKARSVRVVNEEPVLFYESFGCSTKDARRLLRDFSMVSRVPEPIRVAGLVARGLFG